MRAKSGRSRVVLSLLVTLAMIFPATPAVASGHVEVDVVQTFPGGSLEGVAVDKTGNVFASSTFTGELLKFAPGSSDYEVFGSISNWPAGPLGAGFLGLAVDAQGNVYGAAQWGPATGVYRFDGDTGDETRIAGTEGMSFPNSIAFDKRGNMYITDSNSTGVLTSELPGPIPMGAIWRVDRKTGVAAKWIESELLGGNGGAMLATPVGANGIAYRKGVLTVANAEGATLYNVAIERDGSAGDVERLTGVGDSEWPFLGGGPFGEIPAVPDGIAMDVHGGIYVASVAQNAVFRVNTDNSVDVLFHDPTGEILNFPSSVAFGTGNGLKQTLYVVNLAFNPEGAPAALVTLDVGVPGMPVP
ncbi:MAG: SMP-30/gluconolactonase/LRE family protein [Acidimicrobiales bacterium]